MGSAVTTQRQKKRKAPADDDDATSSSQLDLKPLSKGDLKKLAAFKEEQEEECAKLKVWPPAVPLVCWPHSSLRWPRDSLTPTLRYIAVAAQVKELKAALQAVDEPTSGRKAALAERLVEAYTKAEELRLQEAAAKKAAKKQRRKADASPPAKLTKEQA